MPETKNLLIYVNTASEKPYNQLAALTIAFLAKQVAKIDSVTVFYGAGGFPMAKKGELAKIALKSEAKELVASQIEGLSASDLPDNLEQMARFAKDTLGVTIASCGSLHVMDGFAKAVDDTSQIEDFIVPLKIPQALEAQLSADKILYF